MPENAGRDVVHHCGLQGAVVAQVEASCCLMWPSQVFVLHAWNWVGAGMRQDSVKRGLGVQEQVYPQLGWVWL